jgi:hypothetical protein
VGQHDFPHAELKIGGHNYRLIATVDIEPRLPAANPKRSRTRAGHCAA